MLAAVMGLVGALSVGAGDPGSDATEGRTSLPAEIPYFARKYGFACAQCHVVPPKLNEFGQRFLDHGYTLPGREPERTWPVAVWLSLRMDRLDGLTSDEADALVRYVNRLELVSGGEIVAPWLSYFVEWRPLSMEPRSDGSLRDRSGRFEDLFLIVQADRLEVMLGQFRQVQQVDVSQRLSLGEPLVLSASLPGRGADVNGRRLALRSFSPAMRSPSVRLEWTEAVGGAWDWSTAVSLPMPGEFSLPLTREARSEASNELEWRPKGAFVESFVRRGLLSVGAHGFHDPSGGRFLANAITTGVRDRLHWTGMAGLERAGSEASIHTRWSAEAEYFPRSSAGFGMRVEDRAGDGLPAAALPYLTFHFPGTTYTLRLTLEQRIQRGRNHTLVELGTVF